jgi:hypothetical protein
VNNKELVPPTAVFNLRIHLFTIDKKQRWLRSLERTIYIFLSGPTNSSPRRHLIGYRASVQLHFDILN